MAKTTYLTKLLARLGYAETRSLPRRARTPEPCMVCGFGEAILLGTKTIPDFDTTALLPPEVVAAFQERLDGICLNCGYYQAFKRFTPAHLAVINSFGKDITTSNTAFHGYPVPADFVEKFQRDYFDRRLQRWDGYFQPQALRLDNALFLRPYFGASAAYVRDRYGAAVAGLDMSPVCTQTVTARIPEFTVLPGAINGSLTGGFLESGPYDAIFIFHVLTHACDVHESLRQLRRLLKPGGFVVFSHDITRKPFNPFHMLHLSEVQLAALLREHFDRVDRIDDCDRATSPSTTNFTVKGDNPDLVAWVDS